MEAVCIKNLLTYASREYYDAFAEYSKHFGINILGHREPTKFERVILNTLCNKLNEIDYAILHKNYVIKESSEADILAAAKKYLLEEWRGACLSYEYYAKERNYFGQGEEEETMRKLMNLIWSIRNRLMMIESH